MSWDDLPHNIQTVDAPTTFDRRFQLSFGFSSTTFKRSFARELTELSKYAQIRTKFKNKRKENH